jgi:hypothetical protein
LFVYSFFFAWFLLELRKLHICTCFQTSNCSRVSESLKFPAHSK